MTNLLADSASRAARYIAAAEKRPVQPRAEDIARLRALGGSLPDAPSDPRQALALIVRALEVWAVLRCPGRRGLAEMIDRSCKSAVRFADELRGAGYAILNEVALNQVLVSFGSSKATRRVIPDSKMMGRAGVRGTEWHGHTAMRISVSGWGHNGRRCGPQRRGDHSDRTTICEIKSFHYERITTHHSGSRLSARCISCLDAA